ncbi:MAG: hypothetical protein MZU97_23970 [Bacillus subtilis]|nr:hypothetical protein [Bacillus subtilis]
MPAIPSRSSRAGETEARSRRSNASSRRRSRNAAIPTYDKVLDVKDDKFDPAAPGTTIASGNLRQGIRKH